MTSSPRYEIPEFFPFTLQEKKSLCSKPKAFLIFLSFLTIFFINLNVHSQQYQSPTSALYVSKPGIFRQEIARLEITVQRPGKQAISLTQVPRVQAGDVLKVRMLDAPLSGIKPDQSMWDWTLLIAYINPNLNDDGQKSVSQEIRFREKGWYKEHFFTVPYDSQPVVFLYPKPHYRDKILNIIGRNHDDIRKLGEKTIEIAGAYAQISTFLNELQGVLRDAKYSKLYNPTSSLMPRYNYGYGNIHRDNPNDILWLDQAVEGLAKSFNIHLPSCWRGTNSAFAGSNYTTAAGIQDFVGRTQCVAKSIRMEDLDVSITKMWQQGGVFLAAQLTEKYPQIAHWINIAAAAIDFIVKAFRKTALRIVPTVISSQEMLYNGYSYQSVNPYNISPNGTNFSPGMPNANNFSPLNKLTRISVFAETPPNDNAFVTAFPVVLHKWQAEPDPEVIELPTPVLLEPCLHVGPNILKNTDLTEEWVNDTFTRDFKLIVNSSNGFRKEFFLRKNVGLGGWELNVTPQEFANFPKVNMTLEAEITGIRGFNEIKSQKFDLPIAIGGTWSVTPESQKNFTVGGRRRIVLQNSLGTCRCLQLVTYKPSFGGQFIFQANGKENGLQLSEDGREVSFEVNAAYFQAGQGTLELRTLGSETANIPIKLYPKTPVITEVKIAKGDNQAVLTGEHLEQVQSVKINGRKAKLQPSSGPVNKPTRAQGQKRLQRLFIFEDPKAVHTAETVSLELELEGERNYPYPETFASSASRPAIVANEAKEVEGIFINNLAGKTNKALNPQLDLSKFSVFPIEADEINVNLQNQLTDYDFKAEDLSVETRIEKSQKPAGDLIKVSFEVLNWKNMQVTFSLNEQMQKLLGGRRLQFRIKDSERGNSDWYTVKQTFIRIPYITSVKCTTEMDGQCELKGQGIDYIGQVSVDGGKTWFPSEPNGLKTQRGNDGQTTVVIPHYANKKLLQIKLMDFPSAGGLPVPGYLFSNTARVPKKSVKADAQVMPSPTGNSNQPAAKTTP